jgi:gliding motility-associated-like protein
MKATHSALRIQFLTALFKSVFRYLIAPLLMVLFFNLDLNADGSPQFRPDTTKTTYLMILNTQPTYGTFAGYSASDTNRLYIRINDPATERIYFGMGNRTTTNTWYFRVKDPNGNVVYGPTLLPTSGTGFIRYHSQAIAGPNTFNPQGYSPFVITPTAGVAGNYYIEFNYGSGTTVSNNRELGLGIFDITVGKPTTNQIVPGRLFSYNWSFNTDSYANQFFGSFFIYGADSSVTKVDLNGIKPYKFRVSCNSFGALNSGNSTVDRRSQLGFQVPPELRLFLQNPDITAFPNGTIQFVNGAITLEGCTRDSLCLNINLVKKSDVTILIDRNSNNVFDAGTADRILIYAGVDPGSNCLPWDGKDGQGNHIPVGDPVQVKISVESGEVNLPIFDVESHPNGYSMSIVRPAGGIFVDSLFYDDVLVGGNTNITGCPFPCHTWVSNPVNTESNSIGNNNTINTYWFARKQNTDVLLTMPDYLITDAGINQTLCINPVQPDTIQLLGSIIFSTVSYSGSRQWTTSGSGTFIPNDSTYTAHYIPSTADINAGGVWLYLAPRYQCVYPVDSTRITFNKIPTLNTSAAPASCFGQPTGSASVTASNSQSPYTYNWSNGENAASQTAVTSGVYTVTVTSANGCSSIATAMVSQPAAALSASVSSSSDVTCFGASNGSVSVSAIGGTGPYGYQWNTGATTPTLSNLSAGSYSVTITDANGCTSVISSISIGQPSAPLSVSASGFVNVNCFGDNNGSVNLNVNGGTGPYTYNWTNGATTEDISNLPAGTYTVTVTDSRGCTSFSSVTITQPSGALAASVSSNQSVSCFGGSNGTAAATASGGTSPYNYTWSNGAVTQNITGLTAGSYTVTVTDENGCMSLSSVQVTQPAASLSGSLSVSQNVSCFGGNNGSLSLSVANGTAPYTYLWSNGSTSANLTGVSSGTYTVTVTDANGCTTVQLASITQPSAALSMSTSMTQSVACFGQSTGAASASVTGGTSPYSYVWNNGANTASLTGLSAGIYSVTVADANGCTSQGSVSITQPSAALSSSVTSSQQVNCFGGNNGSVNLTVTGGTGPYSYNWNNGASTEDVSNLSAGTYTVNITDSRGCTASSSVTITQPVAALASSASSTQSVSCFGGNNGSATSGVSGGTAPYNYSWSNGASTQSVSSLSTGNYTVTVTDANGCVAVSSVLITQPAAALSSTLSVSQNVSCFGGNNGSLSLSVSNGTAPYNYQWNTGSTASSLSGLTIGTYTVTVTDANGCTNVRTATVGQPAVALTPSISSTVAVSCFGGNDGSVNLSVAGGTAPYSYIWNNGATTQDLSSLATGAYTVSISDANGCTANAQVTITQPAAALASSVSSSQQVSCFGGNNGTVSLSVNGGTAPYSYNWSNGAATQNINGLSAGTYTVTVTDVNGCTATQSRVVTQPVADLSTTANVSQNVSCFGGNNGSVNLSVSGGTTPYTYVWSNGTSTEDLTDLSAGTYTVTVTDVNGCIANRTITVTQPSAAIQAAAGVLQSVSCNNGNDGQISLGISGTSPYTYSWSNGDTTAAINGLSAGSYTVTVTDANGCVAGSSATVTQPSAALSGSTTVTSNISCFSGNNGSINITVAGGTSPYTFMWNTGAISEDLNSLPAGSYSVTITDANGCTANASATITQPPGSLSANLNVSQNVACFGGGNGAFDLTVSGGTPPYSYIWSNGSTTQDISGLALGTYTVSITDANGCISSATGTITQPSAALNATVSSSQDVLCFGGNNGSINITVTGGTIPYSYVWSNGSVFQDINNLSNGTYTVSITDANGCTFSQTATINQPAAALNASLNSSVDVFCFGGDNGSINSTVTGGTAPYSYNWNNGASTQNLNGLTEGTYTVIVTDVNGCNTTLSETIDQPAAAVALSVQSAQAISCFGGNNGSTVVSANGGTAPYSYLWNTGASAASVSNLPAGTYTATVTDINGCSESVSVTLTQPSAPLSSNVNSTVDVLCFGGNNGEIDITINGGTAPYSYNWSNGATTQDINGLVNGAYTVTVTDANGCILSESATINQPAAQLSSSASVTANVLCFAGNNGLIDLSVNGGTTPYTFNWSNGETTEDIGNLPAGTYTVNIIDINGCTSTATAQVTEPVASLTSSVNATQNVSCFAGNNGSIDLTVAGGTAPYTFSWSNGETTEDISNLPAGTYTVNITDANGCTFVNTANISQPQAALNSSINGTIDVSCFGGTNGIVDLSVSGGTLPYTFVWSNGETTEDISNLTAGTYNVSITDANGCTTSASVTIGEPAAALTPAISSTVQINCFGDETGSIDLNVTGGTAPYSFSWNTGDTTEDIDSLFSGTYVVIVTDANGCEATAATTLSQPNAPLLALATVTSNVFCNGGSNGAIDVTVNGGTAPYSFVWNNGETTEDISGLSTGTYIVTIMDASGCATTVSAGIGQPAQQLNASATVQDVLCFNGNNGFIDLIPTGGTPPYAYNWSNGSTSEDIGGLVAGVYSVTITDANGCDTLITATVIQPAAPLIPALTIDNNVSCNGGNDGAMSVTVTGGTQPYIYVWNNGQTSTSITSLPAGQYTLTVTDANGCNAIISDFVSQPSASLITSITVNQDVSCYGGTNGTLTSNATGGTAPYTYVWNTGAMTPGISNVSAGTYTVTVTDSKACTYSVSGTVSQPTAPLSMTGNATIANCLYGIGGDITISVNGGTPGYSYSWSNGSTSQNIVNALPGSYTVNVTDANGCTLTNTYTIGNDSEAELQTGPAIICVGDFTTLWVDSIAGATYQWYFTGQPLNGATAPSFTTPAAGYYYVAVTTVCGTFQTDSVEIQVKSVENATVSNNQIICPPEMVQLYATGGVTYLWTPSKFISSTTSPSPIVAPIQTTTYVVEITNEWGCKAELSVDVAVACDTLFVPTGFSPNDDGVNDGYVIDHIENYTGNRLWIYNRWGNLVYKARDYKNDWNGIANVSGIYLGKKVPSGTYYYILDLNDGSKPRSGYLIIRH